MFRLWLRQWVLPTMFFSALVIAALAFAAFHHDWRYEQMLTHRWMKASAGTLMRRMEQVRQDADFLRQKPQVLDALPELSSRWQAMNDTQVQTIASKFRESRLAPVEFRDSWQKLEGIQDWAEARGYADVLLLDADGLVLYSATGDLALGSSIHTGKSRHTALNTAFREARRGRIYFSDVQPYPGHKQAVTTLFFSTLLEDNRGRPLGVLVLRLYPEALLEALQPASRMLPALRLYGADGSVHLEHIPEGESPNWPETDVLVTRALEDGQGALQRANMFGPMLHFQLLEVMDARWVLAAQDGREIFGMHYAIPGVIGWVLLNGLLIFWLWKLARPWQELLKKVEALPHLSALPELPFQYLPDVRGRFARVFLRLKEMAMEGRGITGEVKDFEERLKKVEAEEDELSNSVRHLTEQMHGLEELVADYPDFADTPETSAEETDIPETAAPEIPTPEEAVSEPAPEVAEPVSSTLPEAVEEPDVAPAEAEPTSSATAAPETAPATPQPSNAETAPEPALRALPSEAPVTSVSTAMPPYSALDEALLQDFRAQCRAMRQHLQLLHRGLLTVAKRQRTVAELKPEKLGSLASRINEQWINLLRRPSSATAPEALRDMAAHAAKLAEAIRRAEGMVRQARLLSINAALEAGNLKGSASFNELSGEIKNLTGHATDTLKGLRELATTLKETAENLPGLWQGQQELAANSPAVADVELFTVEQLGTLAIAPTQDAEEEAAVWLKLTQQTAEIAMSLQSLERRLKALELPAEGQPLPPATSEAA